MSRDAVIELVIVCVATVTQDIEHIKKKPQLYASHGNYSISRVRRRDRVEA